MARPLRIEYSDAVYHVMNRGLARKFVFLDPTDYETFLQVLSDTHALWGIQVGRGVGFDLIFFIKFNILNQDLIAYPNLHSHSFFLISY